MTQIPEQSVELSMRTPHEVMRLEKLGGHYPTRLSFARVLTRRMLRHKWRIERRTFNLDEHSAGEMIYTVQTPNALFTFVVFSHPVDRNWRSDQLTADQWDITATLCAGKVDDEHLAMLRANVPKQESGRLDSRSLVLTRAHSTRSFKYVVDQLAQGKQPQATGLSKEGHLHRTTAIHGSGKVWHVRLDAGKKDLPRLCPSVRSRNVFLLHAASGQL